jgi:uncharacterized membrane protein YgdD (TMEM256/DUF423 family)
MNGTDATSAGFSRRCIAAGSVLMLVGLVLGALGAHLVAGRVSPQQLGSYQTAVLYQLLNSLGLVLVGLLARSSVVTAWLRWSARLMGLGIVLFSGSIYLATAGLPHGVLAVAPAGGLSLMASWGMLALHALARGRD